MIILKLFTVILLALLIWLVMQLLISGFKVFTFFKYGLRQGAQPRPNQPQGTMVKCATCSLYVLDTDAVSRNGMYFCSLDHARHQ